VSFRNSRLYVPGIRSHVELGFVPRDAMHHNKDATRAVPPVHASQQAAAEEFTWVPGDNEGASLMQAMVAGCFMDEDSSRDDDPPVTELADGINDVVELPPEEVYEDFCRTMSYEPIRPSLRTLQMQPATIS